MRLSEVHRVYFLGIGGIGMSAIARLFHSQGKEVYGYDRIASSLTKTLELEGIQIHYTDDPGLIPNQPDLVVYTPAIPSSLNEWVVLQQSGVPVMKRAEILGLLSQDMFTVAVSGTHGKTSITAMLSHILYQSRFSFTGFVGGLMKNYHSNLIRFGNGSCFVVEADEYDRSFHRLKPDIALISAIDADHLDIYGTYEQLRSDYQIFADGLKPGGRLILHEDLMWDDAGYKVLRYGKSGDFEIVSCQTVRNGSQLVFRLVDVISREFTFNIPGKHNIENALGAAAIACLLGIDADSICDALSTFSGVVRRFDIRVNTPDLVYIDDYAHHPKELEAAITAAREYFPGLPVIGVFQPHLYTRTRDLVEGFAQSMDLLDRGYLLDIYPARELPVEGVASEMIAARMQKPCPVVSRDEVLAIAADCQKAVFLTLGAGDIDLMVEPLELIFKDKVEKGARV